MSRHKLTRWFPHGKKPVHVGSYETRRTAFDPVIVTSWWNGKQWLLDTRAHHKPARAFAIRSTYQDRPWRGLREKPE